MSFEPLKTIYKEFSDKYVDENIKFMDFEKMDTFLAISLLYKLYGENQDSYKAMIN